MANDPWGGSEELWSQAAARAREQGNQVAASVAWWPQLSPKLENLKSRGVEVSTQETAARKFSGHGRTKNEGKIRFDKARRCLVAGEEA